MSGRQGESPDRDSPDRRALDHPVPAGDAESPTHGGDTPWGRPAAEPRDWRRDQPDDGGSGGDATDGGGGDGDAGNAHLGWRLSALLDGELVVAEELVARRHLEGCGQCQTEFAQVNAARSLVQGLGPVEPPAGFLERLVIAGESVTGRNRGFGVAGLVSMALVWVLILLLVIRLALPEVVPAVGLVAETAATGRTSAGAVVSAEDLEPPFTVPAAIGEFELITAREVDEGVLLVLDDGDSVVAVLQQEGTLDSAATRELDRVVVGDAEGWETSASGMSVVIVSDAHVVWTIATLDPAVARSVASQRPTPEPYSLADRVSNNFEDLGDRLGL